LLRIFRSLLVFVVLLSALGCRSGSGNESDLQSGIVAAASQRTLQGVEGALVETRGVYGASLPTALVSSADGRYLFSAEGGTLAIMRSGPDGDLHKAIKKPLVGAREGVKAARLLLDPGADLDDEDNVEKKNLIYIAGGRSGLWVMDANVFAKQSNLAVRVDDSTHSGSASRDSRRWCVDLAIAPVGDVEYLFALYGARGDSRLRAYLLQDVRDALWNGGGALAPLVDVRLAGHPQASAGEAALGLSLAVDEFATDRADVYVALASHGLVRVSFSPASFGPEAADPLPEYGPIFGDGTFYNLSPHANADWYGNLEFGAGGRVERSVAPYFVDVAVQHGSMRHYLYVALDHLGWARFDLNDEWGPELAINHHEGIPVPTQPWSQVQLSLSPFVPNPASKPYEYVRRIEIALCGSQPILLATTSGFPFFAQMHNLLTEGRVLNYSGSSFNGVREVTLNQVRGDTDSTLVYRIGRVKFGKRPLNFAARADFGGVAITAPVRQFVGNKLLFFGTGKSVQLPEAGSSPLPYASYRAVADVSLARISVTHTRTREDRPGWLMYGIGDSLVRPGVLLLGANDAGIHPDGFLVDCGSSLIRISQAGVTGVPGSDPRATQGILFDPSAQWRVAGSTDSQFVWGGAARPPGSFHGTWRVSRYTFPATDLCSTSPTALPERTNIWKLSGPPDRFGYRGRWFFQGTLDEQYDEEVTSSRDPAAYLFASRAGTDEGVVVLRRDLIEATLAPRRKPPLPDGFLDLRAAPFPEEAVVAELVTHPEFGAIDETHPDAANFIVEQTGGSVLTMAPKLVRLAMTRGGARDHWVLGVPCHSVANNPKLPIYDVHPEWRPSEVGQPWASTYSHLLVQFWDVDDPTAISPHSTLPRIIGGEDGGGAYFLEFAEVNGRVYVFTADFGGRILVHDVTELLQSSLAPPLVARWVAPLGLTDDLQNNVQGLAVDLSGVQPLVYVAVPRVGVVALRFDPSAASAQRLLRVALVETPGNVRSVHLAPGGRLLVADGEAGVRVLGPVSSE